jgi:hypothetical protein
VTLTRDGAVVRIHEMPTRYSVHCDEHGQLAVDLTWSEALEEQDRHISQDHAGGTGANDE